MSLSDRERVEGFHLTSTRAVTVIATAVTVPWTPPTVTSLTWTSRSTAVS